tara:strand:- start:48 stop:533 length:486 start_codon:yes stop_codon:yes gene_type:complete
MPTTLTSTERNQIIEDLKSRVSDWTDGLCDSLAENYLQYHMRMLHNNSKIFNSKGDRELTKYAQDQLDAIENGTAKLMKFRKISGKKYYKVVQVEFNERTNTYRDGSVTAFVDKNTGEVYKPASWKSPAKHVRFDMRIINHRKACHDPNFTTWTGGFLYMR